MSIEIIDEPKADVCWCESEGVLFVRDRSRGHDYSDVYYNDEVNPSLLINIIDSNNYEVIGEL